MDGGRGGEGLGACLHVETSAHGTFSRGLVCVFLYVWGWLSGAGTVWAGHCVCIGQWSSKCAASGEPIYMEAGPTDGDIYGGRQLRAVVAAACCGVRR